MIKSRTGCLIIHGFDVTTLDVEPLSKYLQSKGFITFCPSLKCSMENRRVFPNANYKDWLESAELGLYYLKSRCKDVVIHQTWAMRDLDHQITIIVVKHISRDARTLCLPV